MFELYETTLRGLGMRHVHHLSIESRADAMPESKLRILDDGSRVTFTNLTEAEPESSLCIYGVRLHVLNQSDTFDLKSRRPRYNAEHVVREWVGLPPQRD